PALTQVTCQPAGCATIPTHCTPYATSPAGDQRREPETTVQPSPGAVWATAATSPCSLTAARTYHACRPCARKSASVTTCGRPPTRTRSVCCMGPASGVPRADRRRQRVVVGRHPRDVVTRPGRAVRLRRQAARDLVDQRVGLLPDEVERAVLRQLHEQADGLEDHGQQLGVERDHRAPPKMAPPRPSLRPPTTMSRSARSHSPTRERMTPT